MATYTTTVETIIDSVITDGQIQTTNRTALLGYVDRVQKKVLRESQWLFLRSEHQKFITEPGVSDYWIGGGSAPTGVVNTGLNLQDVGSIIPDSVYDYSNSRRLTQDSDSILKGYGLRTKDAVYRTDRPRTYLYDYNRPNVLSLYPPPDNQNNYQPVPLSPVCQNIPGSNLLGNRTYYVAITIVDSFGGESIPSALPAQEAVPTSQLLTVAFNGLDVNSASSVTYGFYNVYVGPTATGPFYLQNTNPISVQIPWQEPATGIVFGFYAAPSSVVAPDTIGNIYSIGVTTQGLYTSTLIGPGSLTSPIYLTDSNHVTWLLQVQPNGMLTTQEVSLLPGINPILQDSSHQFWQFGVTTQGLLTTTVASGSVVISPLAPVITTVAPILGYVIGFQYQKAKIQITSTTQFLQVPDDYSDVVIAGVNYYANLYTAKSDDLAAKVGIWKGEFREGLAQMRRDLRINFRNTDFVGPDGTSQYLIGTQAGYEYPFNS